MTRVGRYDLVRRTATSSVGFLYHAKDRETGQTLTVKVLQDKAAQKPDVVVRFLRGAEAAGSLMHPNIVTIYGFGEEEGTAFIAMEYVGVHTLRDVIDHRLEMAIEERLTLCADVADALDYAHGVGVFHRNVKPANIHILPDRTVRLGGFDIAKVGRAEGGHSARLTGTPSHMSPEQVRGGRIDGRSDQFSLGVVLYQLLTHRKPFPAEDPAEATDQILKLEPEPMREVRGGPWAWTEALTLRCLEKDPLRRHDSCRDLADALREKLNPV